MAGCGSDKGIEPVPPFQSEEHVQVWATSASALGVYVHAYEPIAIADGHLSFQDPACPMTSDDGATLTIAGGCTDESDRQWIGRATVRRTGGERTLTFEDFDGKDGTVVVLVAALAEALTRAVAIGDDLTTCSSRPSTAPSGAIRSKCWKTGMSSDRPW
ncbi:hypothetical protein [Sorangium sp. So ce1000]|uniref:hypothetical protein n=1 Tax=Sorangium sp. So ce1000 TaxID=3133325 RepID=UPI003F61A0CD